MIAHQDSLQDMEVEFLAGLDDDFADPFSHGAGQTFYR